MTPTQLAIFALLLGLIVGAAVTTVLVLALRARDRYRRETDGELPDGIAAVVAGMDDAAAVIDVSFLMVATSPAAHRLGMHAGEGLGDADLKAIVRSARTSGLSETRNLRMRIGPLSGELRSVSARATVVSPRFTLLTVRDISEKERIEQMRHDFVSNTSHELKTPVGAVTLLAEAIDMAADDPDQVRIFADRLQAEARRLSSLTGRIMNLSKLQSSDDLAEVRDVSIDEVVAAAVDALGMQAATAGVEVLRGGERGLFVRGDAQILTDAVSNLVANAISYSSEGSRVGIGVKKADGLVEIAISDQGIGIAEDDQKRIFERFYRADQARSRRTGGTGLGLSIVKHAVQRHGGDVRLWSRPGRGSTFTVVLPLTAGPQRDKPHKKNRKNAADKKARPVAAPEAATVAKRVRADATTTAPRATDDPRASASDASTTAAPATAQNGE